MKILVTGGCGFAGHHFIEHILKNTDWSVAVIDKLTYASGGLDRLRDINVFSENRVQVFTADFSRQMSHGIVQEIGEVDYILHMGAETHVDRSIEDAEPFIQANVMGTYWMLEFARRQRDLKAFVYFSTDEVFGPAPEGWHFRENEAYNSTNPYAATKAGGEELAMAYANTHKVPVIVTHTMNMFGERQHPEKFIPKVIRKVLAGDTLTIHSDATRTKAGSRFYIHARNAADGVLFLLNLSQKIPMVRDKFNIVGEVEIDNLSLARMIADILGKPLQYEMVDFHSSRPGHDLRYALDGEKMLRLGWEPPVDFEKSLERTIQWTLDNPKWIEDPKWTPLETH